MKGCVQFGWLLIFLATSLSVCVEAKEKCDVANGAVIYKKCAVCHSLERGVMHGAGPNLHGIVGREVGKVDGFGFSKSMRNSTATWTHKHLSAFLENPRSVYPRNRMAFGGIKDSAARAAVICYLESSSDEQL